MRWFEWVLENKTNVFSNIENTILHFAPERYISSKISEKVNSYITADIVEGRADVVEDMTAISYADNTFDYIICNHVLEHIKEEARALCELYRCIKPNGKVILSVPICWEQKTYEDNAIDTDEKRLHFYGQEDHVRLYGNDIQDRFEEAGFSVEKVSVKDCMDADMISRLSLLEDDVIWLLEKK